MATEVEAVTVEKPDETEARAVVATAAVTTTTTTTATTATKGTRERVTVGGVGIMNVPMIVNGIGVGIGPAVDLKSAGGWRTEREAGAAAVAAKREAAAAAAAGRLRHGPA